MIRCCWQRRSHFYLFFVENMLKVGLRQPYPGILSYFIWGLLIFRVRSLTAADGPRGEGALETPLLSQYFWPETFGINALEGVGT